MEQKVKKSLPYYMRALHRDIGFFAIGIIIIYSLSGIVLIYRDIDFLRYEKRMERRLSPGVEPAELGHMLYIRDFKVTKTEGETVYFKEGSYNKSTGMAVYTAKEAPFPINKFISLHMKASNCPAHYIGTFIGIILFFLAISSFWMFKPSTKFFRRGIYITIAGFLIAILFLGL